MGKFAKVNPGDPVLADIFNRVADALESFANLSVVQGSGLLMDSHPSAGKVLSVALKRDVRALLSGASSPYSWTEVEDTASGATATFGMRSGTTNAYEINGKSGLAGKVVGLTWTGAGDWRFQYVAGLGQCAPGTTFISVHVRSSCSGNPSIVGASVTITRVSDGVVVASGTTNGSGDFSASVDQLGAYSVQASKSGFTTTTTTPTVSACGGTTSTTITLPSITYNLHVHVIGCSNLDVAGASVTLSTGESGTTDASGLINFDGLNSTLSRTMTTSGTGFIDDVRDVSSGPCVTQNVTVSIAAVALAAGYECTNCLCSYPLADILTLTDSRYGPVTLTYNAVSGYWEGSQTVAYAGGGSCPADNVDVIYKFGTAAGGTGTGCFLFIQWSVHLACPSNTAITGAGSQTASATSFSCPPSFLHASAFGSASGDPPWQSTDTFTITE